MYMAVIPRKWKETARIMPGFRSSVTVYVTVSTLPFCNAVAVSVPCTERERKIELDPIWTDERKRTLETRRRTTATLERCRQHSVSVATNHVHIQSSHQYRREFFFDISNADTSTKKSVFTGELRSEKVNTESNWTLKSFYNFEAEWVSE